MNEELKIVITADSKKANENIQKTRKELEKVGEQGEKSKKYIQDTVSSFTKGVTIALASVTALVAGMTAMGKQALENQKNFAKLNTTFQSLGATTKQAQNAYTGLYRFLGDSGKATEAASLLAQITTNEQELAEWTNILKGAYATLGESLPTEAFAESINESIKAGVISGNLADSLVWLGVSEDAVNEKLATLNTTQERSAYLQSLLNSLYGNAGEIYEKNNKEILNYNTSQAQLDTTLASLYKSLVPMLTALNNLANVLLTALKPAFEVVSAAIIVFCQWIAQAVGWIASLFGISVSFDSVGNSINSASNSISKMNGGIDAMGNKLEQGEKAAKELKKATMGFDELNVVSKPAASGSSGGGSGAGGSTPTISMPAIDMSGFTGGFDDFEKTIELVREKMQAILVLVGLIAAGILAWKILDAYTASVKFGDVLKDVGAKALIVAGALLLVKGYTEAWTDGVDWGNLLITLGGIAAILTGLYMQFGTFGVAIGLVAAGIALVILGVKDFISNGATLENTILIIGGAVAIAVGLATAGLSAVVAAIVAVIAAVGAFIVALALEEPAIMSVQEAQENLTAAKEAAAQAELGYINAVDAAEAALNKLKEAEEAAGVTGAELNAQVQAGTLDYANMTDAQKEVYKAYLDNEAKQKQLAESTAAYNDAKKAETLASLENSIALGKEAGNYDKAKESILAAFNEGSISAEECRDLLAKSMSEMSDDAQQTFMKDLPADIQNGLNPHKYESTGTKIKKWFKNVWTDIKGFFSDAGQWFANVGKVVGEALGKAFKAVINGVLKLIEDSVNTPFKLINGCIDILNKVPGVSISKLKLIEIPRLAKGGITTGSTIANIGEAGKEAVLPLERNTEWMDTLADRIASRNNTPTKIVLMVNETELGWANINSINGITKQTGQIQLNLV